jgi:hypothetical protein
MCKKVLYLISLALVLTIAGNTDAATFQWDNGGTGNLWNEPANWDPDGIPTTSDETRVYLPEDANKCVIDSSVTAQCQTVLVGTPSEGPCYLEMKGGSITASGNFQIGQSSGSTGFFTISGGAATTTGGRLWVGMNGTGTFTMTGGELNIYDKVEIGKNANGNGTVYMQGGTLNLTGNSTDLEIGSYGHGSIYMTGGVINLQDNIKLSQGNASTLTGVGQLYLYGGTINAGNLRNPADGIYGSPKMDITEGALTLPGDYRPIVNDYINRGWIVAYDGNGIVNVEYTVEPNQTTVTGRMLDPELAWSPAPRNLATVEKNATLSWKPGIYAVAHNVYFGTDFNDVNNAGVDNPLNVLVSPAQQGTTFNPGLLDLNKTYYWRVDEVNDLDPNSPWKGVVWEFTVVNYVVIDDFEAYNDIPDSEPGSNLVYYKWTDGYANPSVNGAVIGYLTGSSSLDTDDVHSGKQAVPFAYDNSTAGYSEVTVNPGDLAIGNDWTIDNLQVLSLWFYGGMFNAASEQMYVKINGVKVAYQGALTDVQSASWQQWNTNLSDFTGVDLGNVTELGIGFDKTEAFGGRGTVILDDIRLYLPDEEQ